jgi:hypothetical protein
MNRLLGRAAVIALGVWVAAAGCGGGAASHDGGTGGSGSGGTTGAAGGSGSGGASGAAGAGSGGTTGAAGSGSGGRGGGGGASAPVCPAAPPAPAASCTVAQTCFYEDCSDTGRTVARCVDGAWSVEKAPCTTGVPCQGQTCAVGQLCVQRVGGALIAECDQNTCGTGPIGCGCLQSCFGTCTVGGSVQSGVTIMCNTCPSNTCP